MRKVSAAMLLQVRRSNPPGGPWLLHDSTGTIIDTVSDDRWLPKHVEGQSAWIEAELSEDGAVWTFIRVTEGPKQVTHGDGT